MITECFFYSFVLKGVYQELIDLDTLSIPNLLMKDFQSRGLFVARDVHKKILDIYFPKFNEENKTHQQLAHMSESAHEKASRFLKDNPPQKELSAIHLGRLRVAIKKHLAVEMREMDELVKKIIQ